ncbi:glycosyltransferase [Methylobacterium sp. J-026]|uniref:glycosyltransferase n=1 Tax=Methylobacterium sp. J-026 TaxID=2836624 RepID=UPI001FB97294|nr:glycosyltransferase [Methylobacterium sp. J-026]MCJ2136757.1 glycosyltransferase [Methylobacterium sp. J-026]
MDAAPHSDLSAPERSEPARAVSPETAAVAQAISESGLFDPAWYAARHPEAAEDPLAHYIAHRTEAGFDPNPLFDTAWYRAQAPQAGAGALLHYVTHGAAATLDPHPLFDTAWYFACNSDVAGAGANPLQHYLAEGGREGRNVHPLFDTGWYLRQRPDVRAAGLNPLLHFLADGGREGVDPHPLFDSAWYLARHPEVAATGENPLVHYLRTGARLGYDPHPLFDTVWYRGRFPGAGENALLDYLGRDPEDGAEPHPLFDSPWYLDQAPDVAESGMNPAIHYLTEGARAGLGPHPLFDPAHYLRQVPEAAEARANPLLHYLKDRGETDPHPLFDAAWYLQRNPAARGGNPLLHYRLHGAGLDPHPLFDAAFYRARNTDLVASGGSPLAHFIAGGAAEGRDPCRLFDTSWYLARNPDVAGSGQNPLVHFLGDGGREGRDPHPLFDSGWYRGRVPDLGAANPLVHYLAHGIRAGIDPNPLFDAAWYRARHPELGPDADPLADYIARGVHIGSEPHPLFDGGWYLRTYPDLIDAYETPLHHYLHLGVAEGRDPSPDFSTRWYLERHPDVARAGLNPLAHFAVAGRAEGRAPLPLEALHARRVAAERLALAAEIQDIHRHIGLMVVRPTFVVLVEGGDAEAEARTRASLARQIYDRIQVCDTRAAAAEALRDRTEAYLLWLKAGDALPPRALYDLACDINRAPAADLIYGDEEIEGPDGILPFFKPGWSPDYLESVDYIGRAACYRGAAVADLVPDARSAFALSLRLGAAGAPVRHLRRILLRGPDRRSGADETERALIGEHLARTGRAGARVEAARGARRYAVAPGPRDETVSLIAALALGPAGGEPRAVAAFLDRIAAIREASSHGPLDVVAVLDREAGAAEAGALRAAGCRTVAAEPTAGPARGFNAGARAATGPFLLFLDPDLEPVERHWIERMLIQFDKPGIGVVGARLIGADGQFRHAGIVMNGGSPEPIREGHGGADGYFFSAAAARNFLAVSGACLMTRAEAFRAAGGFDAGLDGALWDVDYCLGRRAAGLRVVYEPGAVLADTRPGRPSPIRADEAARFARRWGARIAHDPYYNAAVLRLGPPNYDGQPVP